MHVSVMYLDDTERSYTWTSLLQNIASSTTNSSTILDNLDLTVYSNRDKKSYPATVTKITDTDIHAEIREDVPSAVVS